jgi:HEAT repeat protein
VPALFKLLYSETDRDAARGALQAIDAVGPEALPTLLEALQVEDSRLRFFAVFYLAKLGPEAKDALPILKTMQDSENRRLRRTLERTIAAIEGREQPAD